MLHDLSLGKNVRTFSVSPENMTGEKGMGARTPLAQGFAREAARELGDGWKVNPYIVLSGHDSAVLADIQGQGAIKHIWITDSAKRGRQLILRIWFDDADNPQVEAPLSDFFCAADYRKFRQISSLAVCFNPGKGMNCYFEMPYFRGFRVEIENLDDTAAAIYYQIDCEEKEIPENSLYFHAQFRRVNPLPYKSVYTILDGVTGSGQYVGTYLYWSVNSNGWWGEGEIKFYIDGDREYPTVCGTGTEDYFCGAYNFDVGGKYVDFSTPYSGMHVDPTDETYLSNRRFNLYRFHVTDPIYFTNRLKVTIQALGWRSEGRYLPLQDDISSVAYWYSDTLTDVYPVLPDKDALEIC